VDLYSAFVVGSNSRRSATDHTVYLHHTCLYLVSVYQPAQKNWFY